MCSLVLLTFLLLLKTGAAYAQSTEGYKDFVLTGKNVLLLTKTGQLKLIDVASGEPGISIDTDAPIVALSADRQGNIVIGDTNHLVKSYDEKQKTWHLVSRYSGKLTGLVFTSQNQCFLITNKGIVDVAGNAIYFPDAAFSKNTEIRYKGSWFLPPVSFMDRQDNLWLGFNQGEWGGDVFVFDARKRVFSPLKTDSLEMTMNPVSGFCEDPQNVYMSGGIAHLFRRHGSIARFTNGVATSVLQAEDRETEIETISKDPKTGKKQNGMLIGWRGGHQIGPSAYNPVNKCLYFYSQNGFFKGKSGTDLSSIKQWDNILKPALTWTGGSPYAAGPAMNVLKMQFTADGTLLFLTEHEGLGIYEGKKLRFVR